MTEDRDLRLDSIEDIRSCQEGARLRVSIPSERVGPQSMAYVRGELTDSLVSQNGFGHVDLWITGRDKMKLDAAKGVLELYDLTMKYYTVTPGENDFERYREHLLNAGLWKDKK